MCLQLETDLNYSHRTSLHVDQSKDAHSTKLFAELLGWRLIYKNLITTIFTVICR